MRWDWATGSGNAPLTRFCRGAAFRPLATAGEVVGLVGEAVDSPSMRSVVKPLLCVLSMGEDIPWSGGLRSTLLESGQLHFQDVFEPYPFRLRCVGWFGTTLCERRLIEIRLLMRGSRARVGSRTTFYPCRRLCRAPGSDAHQAHVEHFRNGPIFAIGSA
jgi:hypothetical protein